MKVALISRSGLLEFKNSSAFKRDHLYLRIMYAAKVHVARLWPLTEWTRTDSVASRASSINSKMALAASSRGSRSIYINWSEWRGRACYYLIVLVEPEESEVGDTDGLPVILDLSAGTVDNMCNLVGYHEFQILIQQFKWVWNLRWMLAHRLWKVRP